MTVWAVAVLAAALTETWWLVAVLMSFLLGATFLVALDTDRRVRMLAGGAKRKVPHEVSNACRKVDDLAGATRILQAQYASRLDRLQGALEQGLQQLAESQPHRDIAPAPRDQSSNE